MPLSTPNATERDAVTVACLEVPRQTDSEIDQLVIAGRYAWSDGAITQSNFWAREPDENGSDGNVTIRVICFRALLTPEEALASMRALHVRPATPREFLSAMVKSPNEGLQEPCATLRSLNVGGSAYAERYLCVSKYTGSYPRIFKDGRQSSGRKLAFEPISADFFLIANMLVVDC